jgi:hypothetical protein
MSVSVDWIEQWSWFFRRSRWYDFTFVHFEVEFSPTTNNWKFDFAVLGLGAQITWVYRHD